MGAVFLYTRKNGHWIQSARLESSPSVNYANFGSAISLHSNGNELAVANKEHWKCLGVRCYVEPVSVFVYIRTDADKWIEKLRVKMQPGEVVQSLELGTLLRVKVKDEETGKSSFYTFLDGKIFENLFFES